MDEVSQDVTLQMIDVYHGYSQRCRQPFGKGDSHQQRAHQSWSSCECYGLELFPFHTSPFESLVHHGYYILFVCAAGQFGHHASISFVYSLTGSNVAQQDSVTHHGS